MPKVPKKKKVTLTQLKKKLWELCKQIIRATYINNDGTWECYTCDHVIWSKQDAQTGHFIPKSVCGAYLKHDLRNLRIQCMSCNVWRGGMGAEFYRRMVEIEGQEYVDKLFRDKQKTIKEDIIFIQSKIDEYEKILAELST